MCNAPEARTQHALLQVGRQVPSSVNAKTRLQKANTIPLLTGGLKSMVCVLARNAQHTRHALYLPSRVLLHIRHGRVACGCSNLEAPEKHEDAS